MPFLIPYTVFVKGEFKLSVLFKSLSPFVGHRAFFKSLSPSVGHRAFKVVRVR